MGRGRPPVWEEQHRSHCPSGQPGPPPRPSLPQQLPRGPHGPLAGSHGPQPGHRATQVMSSACPNMAPRCPGCGPRDSRVGPRWAPRAPRTFPSAPTEPSCCRRRDKPAESCLRPAWSQKQKEEATSSHNPSCRPHGGSKHDKVFAGSAARPSPPHTFRSRHLGPEPLKG